ncbi:exocyst complex component Sec3-domain-containing protein [Phaeosphaeriaceae sp. PMI808]|nr:exocyst complex component Sec3-domain-containing protein [Phaeosphaeriaceae sp. PMI808]
MDGRPRNHPNGMGDSRPPPPNRPPAGGARGPPSSTSSSTPSAMSRAERFDDERRRITESCFGKVDDQGQLQESYITHIRVLEDAQHPQSPPPPNSPSSNKKGRIIIISVRNTGRVKLHKARENSNGTFSIGKSWPMEDLSAVDNYVSLDPKNDEEAQRKQWAGEKGFTVTITKPYYWEAGTPKEKEFFIGSMVKIYNKYTKGEFPVLSGFSLAELNSLTNGQPHLATAEGRAAGLAGGRDAREPARSREGTPDQRAMPPKSPGPPPRRPGESPQMMPDDGRRGPMSGPPGSQNPNFRRNPGDYQGPRRPGGPDDQFRNGSRPGTGDDGRRPPPFAPMQGTPSVPDLRQKRSMDPSIRSRPSGDSMRMRPPPLQGRDPMPPNPQFASQTLTPQSSASEFTNRPITPESSIMPPALNDNQSNNSQRSVEDLPSEGAAPSLPPPDQRRPNGLAAQRRDLSPRGIRPGTAQSNASSNYQPPQRRRPFMESQAQAQSSEASQRSLKLNAPQRPQETSDKPKLAPQLKPVVLQEPPPQPNPPPTSPLPQLPIAPLALKSDPAVKDPAIEPAASAESEVAHRPGMDAANKFRKAAAAAGAFKPRAGGAAAKLFAPKETKASDEPDGISGVFVPQRLAPKEPPKEESEKEPDEVAKPIPDRSSKGRPRISTEVVPSVTISSPLSPTLATPPPESVERALSPSPEKPTVQKAIPEPEVRRKKRRSNQQIMNISKLGVDPGLIDEQGVEFESLLAELGWGSKDLSAKYIESLETDIKREIARVEAGSWLNHLEQKDDRVEAVERMLDRAIAECDELEGLLTLYNVELGSLNDDIAFIEAQSQGLQVQTANQRLLQHELQQLVETISITSGQLEPLRRAPIGKINGLKDIESSLVLLYKALITIDPSFVAGGRADGAPTSSGFGNSELATMQALQEKRDRYLGEGAIFLDRLKKHMEITFGAAFMETKDALTNIDQGSMPSLKKNVEAHDIGRNELWMLSPVMLFAKEIDRSSWDALIRMYQTQAAKVYQQEVRDNILTWRKFARKPTGEEQELLFTTQEKETENIASTARKLTVKRSQTLARGLRSASGDKEGKVNKTQDGKLYAYDVFARILEDTGPVLLTEQNFITEFFHATSSDAVDFPDAVQIAAPEARRGPNLWIRKQFEADRAMAKHVTGVMEEIFSFWPTEIQSLVDWAVQADPLQGVGILGAVDRKLVDIEDSNQEFLTRNLQKIHERLKGLFNRFLDEQIRAIEDTKVKIKKRKGVIAFMKTFPHFSSAIENMLPSIADGGDQLEVRRMVDDAYQRMNKAMFESLKVIAKESPTVMASQSQGDPEDKEALNYHILLIENMNHYVEEVDAHDDSVLEGWKIKALDEYNEHMNLYVDAVIRRPLGKLLEFIESTETILTQAGASAQSIAQRSSHSRSVFKKLVHGYDAKEVRKGIEALKKRVDKHFGDADDPTISRDLVFKVLKECEKKYIDVCDRTTRINQDVYSGEVEMDWGTNEVAAAFKR